MQFWVAIGAHKQRKIFYLKKKKKRSNNSRRYMQLMLHISIYFHFGVWLIVTKCQESW